MPENTTKPFTPEKKNILMSRSTIGGGRVCNKFVPVLGKDGTRIAPPGDLIDQPPREIS